MLRITATGRFEPVTGHDALQPTRIGRYNNQKLAGTSAKLSDKRSATRDCDDGQALGIGHGAISSHYCGAKRLGSDGAHKQKCDAVKSGYGNPR